MLFENGNSGCLSLTGLCGSRCQPNRNRLIWFDSVLFSALSNVFETVSVNQWSFQVADLHEVEHLLCKYACPTPLCLTSPIVLWCRLMQSQKPSRIVTTKLVRRSVEHLPAAHFSICRGQPSGPSHLVALLRESDPAPGIYYRTYWIHTLRETQG